MWVDVKNDLPRYNQRVLVKDILVRIGKRTQTDSAGDVWELEGDETKLRDMRYWMPLPS